MGSRPDHLGSDLIQIEERIRVGSMVCGNFGGASLQEIQIRKKLAALTAVTPMPESADAGASTAHIFAGKQLKVRRAIFLKFSEHVGFRQGCTSWPLVGLRTGMRVQGSPLASSE